MTNGSCGYKSLKKTTGPKDNSKGSVDLNECQSLCLLNSECKGFSYKKTLFSKTCYIHLSSDPNFQFDSNNLVSDSSSTLYRWTCVYGVTNGIVPLANKAEPITGTDIMNELQASSSSLVGNPMTSSSEYLTTNYIEPSSLSILFLSSVNVVETSSVQISSARLETTTLDTSLETTSITPELMASTASSVEYTETDSTVYNTDILTTDYFLLSSSVETKISISSVLGESSSSNVVLLSPSIQETQTKISVSSVLDESFSSNVVLLSPSIQETQTKISVSSVLDESFSSNVVLLSPSIQETQTKISVSSVLDESFSSNLVLLSPSIQETQTDSQDSHTSGIAVGSDFVVGTPILSSSSDVLILSPENTSFSTTSAISSSSAEVPVLPASSSSDESSSTVTYSTTPVTSSSPMLCPCRCKTNLSVEQTDDLIEEIKKALIIEPKSTSRSARTKKSAEDNRPSAQTVGYVAILFLSLSIGGLFLLDGLVLLNHVKVAILKLKHVVVGTVPVPS
ncbi:uncharacterized threonine-rich GPI-anchored glycoprotein PJ4664.02-like [Gigantopelta aegis]|uniref:uncharacterized threonine-rich GPI-anchored glycoprotein PJ4664.02-like n=1 Tax=Gigantopelta aegis TaxID=1735272 RepID=UPI001B88DC59|nr:uncharacterized threonine-rich GPI-anchored glycoprotein PJ4664.02-like [Gigantopelta aegis]